MEIQGFRIEMQEEIKRKWESRLKVLEDSYEKKTESLQKEHSERRQQLREHYQKKEQERLDKARHDGELLRLKVLSRLSMEFKVELLEGLEEYFVSKEGQERLLKYMDEILENRRGFTVVVGRRQHMKGFLSGDFEYGFRIVCPESGVELDYTELFLTSILEEKVDMILEEEILNEDN